MRKTLCSLFCTLLLTSISWAQTDFNRTTISGYVREGSSGEALIGVNVYLPGTTIGTTTNTYGFYSLTLPAQDSVRLAYSFVGFETVGRTIGLRTNIVLNIALTPGRVLNQVEVRAGRTEEKVSESVQMSRIDIPVSQIKKIPAFLGEKDVLKVLQLMPGVQKGSEGQTGIYVRGGGPDQNLIILDDAIVYNANHLFGFFSVFNGDALKSVELTKGGFPARYGGRLSSVIELNMKDGNREKLHGEGGIGLIASRLMLEGPLTKSKRGSFLLSGRRTYIDVLATPLIKARSKGDLSTGYYFYDLNTKANYDLGPNDKVYLSSYLGRDRFYSSDKTGLSTFRTGLDWGNATGTFRWNHLFSEKLFANTSLTFSDYRFAVSSDDETINSADDAQTVSLRYRSAIRDFAFKYDVDFYPNPTHSLRFGGQSIYHRFTPSAIVLADTREADFRHEVTYIDVLESGIYAEDTWRPGNQWRVNAGIRVSHFVHKKVTYVRPEPRLSAAYIVRPGLSVKASYALMNQYVHLLSNTGVSLPTDLWVPTTDRVRPQQSQQAAVGLANDFAGNTALSNGLTLTVEAYYKRLSNIISYREGTSFLLVGKPEAAEKTRWEDNVTAGRGWSCGAEVLLQKKAGRFSGWIGYTLSLTQWQFAELNGGRPFYPRYDRRHDVSVVGIYELSKRITLSGTWVYGTGNALTLPVANYTAYVHQGARPPDHGYSTAGSNLYGQVFGFGRTISEYGEKNSFRAEAYHRLDVSLQMHRKMKHHERTWEFSLYNAYSRRNPFYYLLDDARQDRSKPPVVVLKRYSIFPILPSFSYTVKF